MEQQNHMERAEAFIALVRESAGLCQKNIQRARGYVSILLTEQESKGVPTMKSKGDREGTPPANKPLQSGSALRCAFCGKPDSQVQRMIQGPGVCICDDCVYLCLQVLLVPLD